MGGVHFVINIDYGRFGGFIGENLFIYYLFI